MPCFGSSEETRYPILRIKCDFPPDPEEYLPRLTEHNIQSEPDDVIDDPSSVFFDPNEKPGFVYTHVPTITFDYSAQLILTLPEKQQDKISILSKTPTEHAQKSTRPGDERHERQVSVCSDFADSLDRTPSLRASPLHESTANGFKEHFKPLSRQDSLEFDPIVDGSILQVTLNNKDFLSRPTSKDVTGLSEDDVRTLYKTSHDPFFIDDFNDMHIYEENMLNDINAKTNNGGNKGYISDAESVKTYQDSGIYDDDIIMESPNRLSSIHYPKGEMFDDEEDHEHDMQMEKYSAFKTPLSSRHNSLEYLPLESPLKSIIKQPRKGGDGCGGSENDSLDNELKETFLDLETSERRKKGDKYSHIQAKVQCFRSKGDKSPCRTPTATRNKTPEPIGRPNRGDLKRTQSRIGVKPKVDSLSNVKYTPGGGGTKGLTSQANHMKKEVFKEKLKFRENAQPRTDTHGIEMYAHLPTEFQEIARRLARQDSKLNEQKCGGSRGRSLQRQNSSGSLPGSGSPRRGSLPGSGSPKRGRSCTKKSKMAAGDSLSNIHGETKKQSKQLDGETIPIIKRPTLSRSSSIRSVPSAPKIHQRHPSSSKITRNSSAGSQSPGANSAHGKDNATKPIKKKGTAKTKTAAKSKEEKTTTISTTITTKTKKLTSQKGEKGEKVTKLSKMKTDTAKMAKNTQQLTQNTLAMAENTAKLATGLKQLNESGVESPDTTISSGTTTTTTKKDRSSSSVTSQNISSLSQYISENESFAMGRPRGVGLKEELKSNPLSSLCQYITDHELLDSSRREDISSNLMKSVCPFVPENELMDSTKLSTTNRLQGLQVVQAH